MRIDPEKHEKVLMPCKRGTDRMTRGEKCVSRSAYKISTAGSKYPSFKCETCGFEWTVPTGGAFTAC